MRTVNPETLSDTNDFSFKPLKTIILDQIDVFHKGNRVAIVNGIDGAGLRWTCNSSQISSKNIDKLESMIKRAIRKSSWTDTSIKK
jgi:hypothetical protein